jgi:DNA-binding NarL/FixJ family response regulator
VSAPQRIVIADDHPMVRRAVGEAVSKVIPGALLVEAGNLGETMTAVGASPAPDLLLLDLNMPGMDGFTGLAALRAAHPAVPILVVTAHEDPQVPQNAARFGAAGYVPKSAALAAIGEAVKAVLDGEEWFPDAGTATVARGAGAGAADELTPQQARVLVLLADGKLNKQIAHDMAITEATVKAHITAIFRKLGVKSRTQAVIAARRPAKSENP